MSTLVVILAKHLLFCLLVDKCHIFLQQSLPLVQFIVILAIISESFSLISFRNLHYSKVAGDKTNSKKKVKMTWMPKLESISEDNWNI